MRKSELIQVEGMEKGIKRPKIISRSKKRTSIMEVTESITSNRSEWQKRICGQSVLC